ncbi:MAG: hypothetical protein ACXVB9_07520 [Bdellovibrionota bacterium]
MITAGLLQKMNDYKEYRAHNLETLNALVSTESGCQKAGATMSSNVANMAAALSCGAQFDASKMNQQMTELGANCEDHFKQINELQTQIHAHFETVKKDLDDGMAYMANSAVLNQACPDKIQKTKEMVLGFLQLESNIVGVEARSLDGRVNYGKFRETAQTLQATTAASGKSCGTMASAMGSVLGSVAKGIGGGDITARTPSSASDVTGVSKELHEDTMAGSILQAQGTGNRRTAAGSIVTGAAPAMAPPFRNTGSLSASAGSKAFATGGRREGGSDPSFLAAFLNGAAESLTSAAPKERAAPASTPSSGKEFQQNGAHALSGLPSGAPASDADSRLSIALADTIRPATAVFANSEVDLFTLVKRRYRNADLIQSLSLSKAP